MNPYEDILAKSEKYVCNLFELHSNQDFAFHNLVHTQAVVKRARLICSKTILSESELFIIIVAAWFHDTGYLFTKIEHEEESKRIVEKFLVENGISSEEIFRVKKCISATKFPQRPSDYLSEILCDADLSHLAHFDFFCISTLLFNEICNCNMKKLSELSYWNETLELFNKHHYFTEIARLLFEDGKNKNFKILQKKVVDLTLNTTDIQ